jgi:hypothetical protein
MQNLLRAIWDRPIFMVRIFKLYHCPNPYFLAAPSEDVIENLLTTMFLSK